MSASVSSSEVGRAAILIPASARACSRVEVKLARVNTSTHAASLFETGGLRLRFPKANGSCEGVFINTGGGIIGGDRVAIHCDVGPRASATLTTQSAEKIYRAESTPAEIGVTLRLAQKSELVWLPQETILFDGARLSRTFDAAMTADASLTLMETVVFGRIARAERLGDGLLRDRWHIRRDGRLIFAEAVLLDGPIGDLLDQPACGGGARAIATLLHIAPKAETRLAGLRGLLKRSQSTCGASAFNGLLVARFASLDPAILRQDVARAAQFIVRGALPRVWSC
jgi:urease accessory protein